MDLRAAQNLSRALEAREEARRRLDNAVHSVPRMKTAICEAADHYVRTERAVESARDAEVHRLPGMQHSLPEGFEPLVNGQVAEEPHSVESPDPA